MSKVLSSNVSSGLGAGSSPCFLFEVESANSIFRYATFACNTTTVPTWTGPDFEGKIAKKGLSKIKRAIDIREGGNIAQVGSWTVKILNQGLISDTLASESFYNRRAELRMIFLDKTSPSWMNAVQLAPIAFVEDVEWDEDAVTFRCSDGWSKRHRDLPKRKLTVEEFADLPSENDGVVAPIIYGDFSRGSGINAPALASNISPSSNQINHRDYFRALIAGLFEGTGDLGTALNPRSVIACHEMHTYPLSNQDPYKFKYNEDARVWHKVAIRYDSVEAFGTTPGLLTAETYLSLSSAFYPETYGIIPAPDSSTSTTDEMVNEDDSDYTALNSGYANLVFRIPFGINIGQLSALRIWWKIHSSTGSALDRITVRADRSGETFQQVDTPTTLNFESLDLTSVWPDTLESGDIGDIKITFAYAERGAGSNTYNIQSVFVEAITKNSQVKATEIYDTGKGRKFGSWIDSPDHSNSFSSGDLIENPAYFIESLLCDELNLKVKERGAAIQFQDDSGSTPYFQVPHSASLALSGIVSIECWVKFISFVSAGENFIVAKIDAGGDIAPYALSVSTGGKIRFWRGDGTTSNYLESTTTLTTGVWYHIVATAAGGSGATRYIHINGVNDAGSSIIQAVADSGNVLRIGLRAGAATRTNMILDELRIWDRVISLGEAAQLYNGGAGYPKPYFAGSTKAWWRFDEEGRTQSDGSTPGAAINATDSSGNGNTAASNNHANMRWVTGAGAKVLYTESEIEENNSVAGAQSSFDVVAGERSSWKFARQYLDQENSLDMIKALSKNAHIGYFPNYLGEETIARIDAGESTPSPSTYGVNQTRVKGESSTLKVKRGDLKYYYNEFYLRYKPNMATGEPEELLFVSTPDGASYTSTYTNLTSGGSTYWGLCQTAYQSTLQVNRWEYTAQNIRDAATAELFLKEIIRHLTRRPYICSFNSGLSMLVLELLDLVKLTHALLPSSIDNSSRFRLTMQEIDPNECEMTNEFFEVGTP